MAQKLHLKKCLVKVKDHEKWGKDELIGNVTVDLHTIATGPIRHILPLRDGGAVRGEVCFSIEMQELADLEVHLKNVEFDGDALDALGLMRDNFQLHYGLAVGDAQGDSALTNATAPGTARYWPYMDVLYCRGVTAQQLYNAELHFMVCEEGRFGKRGEDIAQAIVRVSQVLSFEPGASTDFQAPVMPVSGGPSGLLSGTVRFTAVPTFVQMLGGWHADDGIHNATYARDDLLHLPKVPVHEHSAGLPAVSPTGYSAALSSAGTELLRAGLAQQASMVAQPAHAAVGAYPGMPQAAPIHTPQPNIAARSRFAGAVHAVNSGRYLAAPSPMPATTVGFSPADALAAARATPSLQAAVHATRAFQSSSASTPATSAGMSQAGNPAAESGFASDAGDADAVRLPWFWDRAYDSSSGHAYFKNHVTRSTVWQLPTQPTYNITVAAPGPMGIELGANWSGRARGEGPSGRRNSATDCGAVVLGVSPEGQVGRMPGSPVQFGHHLIAINGTQTLGWTFNQTLQHLMGSPRPVQLTFHDPFAVKPEVAAAAADTSRDCLTANIDAADAVGYPEYAAPRAAGAMESALHHGAGGAPAWAAAGWQQRNDAQGRVYYFNPHTNVSQWEVPA